MTISGIYLTLSEVSFTRLSTGAFYSELLATVSQTVSQSVSQSVSRSVIQSVRLGFGLFNLEVDTDIAPQVQEGVE
jgi:hypothetical protein